MCADGAGGSSAAAVRRAAAAVRRGEPVVYPTETVYGLGADARSGAAVGRLFDLKRRDRSRPVSVAFPTVAAALDYVAPTPREERFMRAFLPGPVTPVVARRGDALADAVAPDRDRVGVRVPAHGPALAFLAAAGVPVTATSANVSGRPSVRRVADLDDRVRDGAGAVVDGGRAPGTESTVVDPGRGEILRRGARADAVAAWLDGGRP